MERKAHDLQAQGSTNIFFDAIFPSTPSFTISYTIAAANLGESVLPVAGHLLLSATATFAQEVLTAPGQAGDLMLAADTQSHKFYLKCILEALVHRDTSINPALGRGGGAEGSIAASDKPYTLPLLLYSAHIITKTLVVGPALHATVHFSQQICHQGLPESVEPSQRSEVTALNFTQPLTSAGVVQHAMVSALKLIAGHVSQPEIASSSRQPAGACPNVLANAATCTLGSADGVG